MILQTDRVFCKKKIAGQACFDWAKMTPNSSFAEVIGCSTPIRAANKQCIVRLGDAPVNPEKAYALGYPLSPPTYVRKGQSTPDLTPWTPIILDCLPRIYQWQMV